MFDVQVAEELAWWDRLPPQQQRLIEEAIDNMATARISGDREQEGALRYVMAWLSRDLCGNSATLVQAFDTVWQRAPQHHAWKH